MPVIHWSCAPDAEAAARVVGPRLRQLRESRGLTIRELAQRADISKNTLLRLEHGEPIAERALHRLCDCLQTIVPNLLDAPAETDRSIIKVHLADSRDFRIAFRRKSAPSRYQDFELVDDPAERNRLGRVGFVSGFVQGLGAMLNGGRLEAALVELHGPQERPGFRHSGEEFVYVLSGRLRLKVADEVRILEAGDSAVFFSAYRHRYESDLPPTATDTTRILMVWYEGNEDSQALAHDDECEDDS